MGRGPFAAMVVKFRATKTTVHERVLLDHSYYHMGAGEADLLSAINESWLASTYMG